MIKLYRRAGDKVVAYHEAWCSETEIVEHWGPLGETGESNTHARDAALEEGADLERVLAPAREQGFNEIDGADHVVCLVEYLIDGMGSPEDLAKRHALEDRLNETLGWTGLGACDGGSIGSGTMEVCSFVVDFGLAQRVIAEDLAGTEFADYHRIYDEGEESALGELPKRLLLAGPRRGRRW